MKKEKEREVGMGWDLDSGRETGGVGGRISHKIQGVRKLSWMVVIG